MILIMIMIFKRMISIIVMIVLIKIMAIMITKMLI